jgi:hypothetical protein
MYPTEADPLGDSDEATDSEPQQSVPVYTNQDMVIPPDPLKSKKSDEALER